MDEPTWLACQDTHAMLDELFPHTEVGSTQPQPRRSRLYLFACARRAWDKLPGVCRAVVNLGERVYGGRVVDRELRNRVVTAAEGLVMCRGGADDLHLIGRELVNQGHATRDEVQCDADVDPEIWLGLSYLAYYPFSPELPYFRRIPAELLPADLAREVFGNPFRRVPPLPGGWRTDNVTRLAQLADATADYSVLPILADALEDAGCDRRDILDHMRHGDPHVRGCWALEWVLEEPRRQSPRLL